MSLFDIISGTPWWVFVIFIYLLIVGIKSLYPSSVSLARMISAPAIFLGWSFYSFYKHYYTYSSLAPLLFFGSLVVGWLIAQHFLIKDISVTKSTQTIHVKGSWIPLALFMSFFALKYFVGISYALDPSREFNPYYWMTNILVSGIICGISWGRAAYVIRKLCTE